MIFLYFFLLYKSLLVICFQLSLAGVQIARLGVATGTVADELHTGWSRREIEASRGIDFGSQQSVRINLQHLDHKPYFYHILVSGIATSLVLCDPQNLQNTIFLIDSVSWINFLLLLLFFNTKMPLFDYYLISYSGE